MSPNAIAMNPENPDLASPSIKANPFGFYRCCGRTLPSIVVDVNLPHGSSLENHEHHQVARACFAARRIFATCPVSQLGLARVSSHPTLGYSMSPDQAVSVLRAFLADARHHCVSDDLSCEDRVVRTDAMTGSNQITDHYGRPRTASPFHVGDFR
jgi:predicted nucleic acid-binding protein